MFGKYRHSGKKQTKKRYLKAIREKYAINRPPSRRTHAMPDDIVLGSRGQRHGDFLESNERWKEASRNWRSHLSRRLFRKHRTRRRVCQRRVQSKPGFEKGGEIRRARGCNPPHHCPPVALEFAWSLSRNEAIKLGKNERTTSRWRRTDAHRGRLNPRSKLSGHRGK